MANSLFFIETQTAKLGRWFLECDRDTNDRAAALASIRNGEAIKVLEVTEPCEDFPYGRVVDCTAELTAEAAQDREPASLDEIHQRLIDLQNDMRRDYRKHGVV